MGNRPTADIATAVLIDYGVIQPGNLTLAINPSKVQRARKASRRSSQEIQFTTSSRRLDGGAYCGAPVGGKCIFMGWKALPTPQLLGYWATAPIPL